MDIQPATLSRKLLGEFIKSPETIRAFENLSASNNGLAGVVSGIQAAPLLTLGQSDVLHNERILTSDGEIGLTDGGPGGNLTLGLSDTGVSPGSYGDASHLIKMAVNEKGRISLVQSYDLNSDNAVEGAINLFFTAARAAEVRDYTDNAAMSWSVKPSPSSAIAAFLATTTAATASLPNTAQRPLYVPAGLNNAGTNVTISATGAAQVVKGDGANSVLQNASLVWDGFSYGGAHDLHLRGASDYGVKIKGTLAARATYHQLSGLTIRDKTVAGVALDGTDSMFGVSNVSMSDIMSIGNPVGLDVNWIANVDIINFNSSASTQKGGWLRGINELKLVNSRFGEPLDGPSCLIEGTAAMPSLESYFTGINFNQGSWTNDTPVTIEPYNAGTQLKITIAAGVDFAVGWQQVKITSASYGTKSRWAVAAILSLTEAVLSPISGVSPAGPYAATEAGTYNRQYHGLDLRGEVSGSATYLNDLFFYNIASNSTGFHNAYNISMFGRGGFSKERAYMSGQNNRLFMVASLRGRGVNPYADILPCGPSSHTGWGGVVQVDPTGSLAPGGVLTGVIAPMKDWGVNPASNQPFGYAFMLVGEDKVRIGCAAYPDLDHDWQWKRATTGDYLTMSAIHGARITSNDEPVGWLFKGRASGGAPTVEPYGPDPNIGLDYKTKGTQSHDFYMNGVRQVRMTNVASADAYAQISGGVGVATFQAGGAAADIDADFRAKGAGIAGIKNGAGTRGVAVSNTGIGFNGTAPVAKPSITGSLSTVTDAAAKAVLTSIIAAITGPGLATNATT